MPTHSSRELPSPRSPWPSAADRSQTREAKREAVLRTAVRLFNEKGFRATSLDHVAGALRVTKPTIYHYFASKEDVLFACVHLGVNRLRDAVHRGAATAGTGRDRLESLLQLYAEAITSDFGVCLIRTDERQLSPDSFRHLRSSKREVDTLMRDVLRAGVADGSLAVQDVKLCAFALASALNGIALWYSPDGPHSGEYVARVTTAQLMNGVADPRPASA